MKKIVLCALSIFFAVGLIAQSSREFKEQKQPTRQEIYQNEIFTSQDINKNASEIRGVRERISTESLFNIKDAKDTYTPWGWAESTEYTMGVLGVAGSEWKGEEVLLFPDDQAGKYSYQQYAGATYYIGAQSIGYVFDPYSLSYGEQFNVRYFEDKVGHLYNYRIDTLSVAADYRIANYNSNSPDTLRITLSHFDIYSPQHYYQIDYFPAVISQSAYYFLSPAVQYITNPIPAKGTTLQPKASNTVTFNYILSTNDSVNPTMGYVRGKYLSLPVNYEVPEGSVVGVTMKFIPGYTYNNKDTLMDQQYNSSGVLTYSKIHKNIFSSMTIRSRSTNTPTDLYDHGYGYNTILFEDMKLRNKASDAHMLSGSYCYALRLDYLPLLGMKISAGTQKVLYEPQPQLAIVTNITEISADLSGAVTVGANEVVDKGFMIRKVGESKWNFISMDTVPNNQFSTKINLIPDTEYEIATYVQAIKYDFVWVSPCDTFKTLPNTTTLVATPPTSITRTSATLNAVINADILGKMYEPIVIYRKAGTQTWNEYRMQANGTNLTYTIPTGRLSPGTTYEVAADIFCSWFDSYYRITSEIITFQTLPSGPNVNTIMASDITKNSVVLNGNIIEDSAEPVIMQGFEWRKQGDSTYNVASGATNPIRVTLSDLQPNTAYEFRAFAITSNGSYYGNIVPFTTLTVGIATLSYDELSLYPNPTLDKIFIKTIFSIEKVSVFDIKGKEVKSMNDVQDHFSIGELNDGVYLIKIKTNEGEVIRKIVKQ